MKFLEKKESMATPAGLYIGLLKEAVRCGMHNKEVPLFLGLLRGTKSVENNLTAMNLFHPEGINAIP